MLNKKKHKKGYHLTFTISDFATYYVEENPHGISRAKFIQFMRIFFKELSREIVENRYRFQMPYGLGTIRIKKGKNSDQLQHHKIDFKRTKELKRTVYHMNLHTNRYYFKWFWEKERLTSSSHFRMYEFKPVRANKKRLSHHIVKCSKDPTLKDYDCLP